MSSKIKRYSSLFLVDFELLGHKETGIELIENLNISSSAILVSSRYEEKGVRQQAEKNNVRIIPKSMAALVPILIHDVKKFDLVLIDDDPLVDQA